MLSLFLVAVIGFTGLCKYIAVQNVSYEEGEWQQNSFQEWEVNSNVEYYQSAWENSIIRGENGEIAAYDKEARQSYEYWKYLSDHEIRYDDWMYTGGFYEEYCSLKFIEAHERALTETERVRLSALESYMAEDGWRHYFEDERLAAESGSASAAVRESEVWYYTYALEHDICPAVSGEKGQRFSLLQSAYHTKRELSELTAMKEAGAEISDERLSALKDSAALYEYRLEHDILRDISAEVKNSSLFELSSFTFWSVFAACKTLIPIVGMICIVIAGSIVASEFSQGTYKFLLMSPAKRWKILVSKFATVLLFGIVLLIALYLLSLVCCLIFFGASELSFPMLTVQGGEVIAMSPFVSLIGDYLLSTIEILSMMMLALAISSLLKGNALAISLSLIVFLSGSFVEQLLRAFDVDFGRYLLFSNLNLPELYAGTEFYPGQTFGFAVAVILCHLVVFGLTAWDAFTRREM